MRHTLRVAALAILLAAGIASPAAAQYMYLDSNGDGVHTAADVMGAAGTPTTVKIYLDTARNRDGSPAFCNTADGNLTVGGYVVNLRASELVNFGAYTNGQPSLNLSQGVIREPTDFMIGFRKVSPPFLPAGSHLLGTLTVTASTGTTSLEIVDVVPASSLLTGFTTQCSGNDFDNNYKLSGSNGGTDWFDTDGLGPAGGGTSTGEPPTIDPISDQTVDEGSMLALTATASDPESNPLLFSLAPGAPSGAGVSPVGAFTWTPDETQGGSTYPITIQVTDGASTVGTSFQITVNETNTPPTVDPIEDQTFSERVQISFPVTVTDPDMPPNTITRSLVTAPLGAAITPGGAFSWMASEEQGPGSYPIVVRAEDGTPGSFDDEEFTLHITEFNLAPVITSIPDQTVNEGATATVTVTATDEDLPAQPLQFSLFGAPLGATINAATGAFSWTATGPGDYPVTVVVSDQLGGIDFDDFTIHVTDANGAPVLNPIGDRTVDESIFYDFWMTATDPDFDHLTFSLISGGSTGAQVSSSGQFLWAVQESQGGGTYSFTVQVSDGALTDSETFSVTVNEVNQPPSIAASQDRTMNENSGFFDFPIGGAHDQDIPAQPLTWSLGPGVPDGFIFNPATARYSWIPTEAQGPGVYTIIVQVSDGSLTSSDSFTITVNEVNAPPVVARIDDLGTNEFQTVQLTATATDFDIPANPFTFSLAPHGTGATITPQGVFSWTPVEADHGEYPFTVIATDNGTPALQGTETFTVFVNEVNTPPVLNPVADMTVAEGAVATQQLTASDADLPAQQLYFFRQTGPLFFDVTLEGLINLSPGLADAGTYTANVIVSDVHGFMGQDFQIVVTNVNGPPTLTPIGAKSVHAGNLLAFTATATDLDGSDVLSFSLDAGAPAGAAITSGGAFTWTAGGAGVYPVTIRVSDNANPALSDFETIQITVTNEIPVLDPIGDRTAAEAFILNFFATGSDGDAGDVLVFSLDPGAPSGASMSPEGEFFWVPSEAQGGSSHSVTIRLSDGADSDFETIQIAVAETNRVPIFNPLPSNMTVNEGASASQQLVATDADIPAQSLTYSKLSGPFFMTVTSAGLVTVSPGSSDAGVYPATVRASDGAAVRNATFQITVVNVNHAPVASAGGPYNGSTNAPVSFDGTGSSDPDGETLTYSWNYGDTTTGTGATPSHQYAAAGTYNVTLTVSDGIDSDQDATTATIQANQVAALVFFSGDNKFKLNAGKQSYCAQIQPVSGSFALTNVDLGSIVMISEGTGSVSRISSQPGKATALDGDANRDGIQEIKACFGRNELRSLFSNLGSGSHTVTVAVEGNLLTGGKFHGEAVAVVSGVTGGALAASISPNPLNPKATLTLSLAKAGTVKVDLFDVQGRLMRTLMDGTAAAGYVDVEIDGIDAAGRKLASGIYYVNIVTSEGRMTKPITILK